MRKILFGVVAMVATLAVGCDSRNQATYEGAGSALEDHTPVDPADTTSIHKDTTTSGGMNRQSQYDTLK